MGNVMLARVQNLQLKRDAMGGCQLQNLIALLYDQHMNNFLISSNHQPGGLFWDYHYLHENVERVG